MDFLFGGYRLRLELRQDLPHLYWPLESFVPFLISGQARPDILIQVHVVRRLPALQQGKLIFDSCHGLWRLYEADSEFVLETDDTKTLAPRARAVISREFASVQVWLSEEASRGKRGWLPMHVLNPLAEICLLTRLGREGGVLLHASGALLDEEGWAFTGPSGAGKSTMADLFASQGARVLSDERLIIRKQGSGFFLYGTPWVGAGRHARNQSGRLTRLFCIRHGRARHALACMTPRDANQWVLQQSFLPHWDREALQGALDTVGGLVDQVDGAELAFLKEPTILSFLRSHSSIHPFHEVGIT